jgi:hypothetical protein
MVGSCFYLRQPPKNVQLHLLTPEPGTELLEQFRGSLAFDGFVSDCTFPTLEPDDSAIMADAPDIFMNNHYFLAELSRRRHVLVTTLYYVLYDLSPLVLCYLMDQFDGRLSALMDAFDHWAIPREVEIATAPALENFCADQLGADHPVTSLVRYMNALAAMSRPAGAGATNVTPATRQKARHRQPDAVALNPDAAILENIYDCTRLLSDLAHLHDARTATHGDESVDLVPMPAGARRRGAASLQLLSQQSESDWTSLTRRYLPLHMPVGDVKRGNFLVLPIRGSNEARNVPLSHDLTTLLRLFAMPRSLNDFQAVTWAAATSPLVKELLDLDALMPVEASAR